jgi:hypothetical protein
VKWWKPIAHSATVDHGGWPRAAAPEARVAELADALDLGSSGSNPVGVQVPPLALNGIITLKHFWTGELGAPRLRARLQVRDSVDSLAYWRIHRLGGPVTVHKPDTYRRDTVPQAVPRIPTIHTFDMWSTVVFRGFGYRTRFGFTAYRSGAGPVLAKR